MNEILPFRDRNGHGEPGAAASPSRLSTTPAETVDPAVRGRALGTDFGSIKQRLVGGAWVADAAVQVAAAGASGVERVQDQATLREALGEMARSRTQLAKAGGLLNQAVAGLHSLNLEEDRLTAYAEYVWRRVKHLDGRLDDLWKRLP